METLKACVMLCLLCGTALAVPPQAPFLPQGPLPPQAPPARVDVEVAPKPRQPAYSYAQGAAKAQETGKPLLTWVGDAVPDDAPEGFILAQTFTLRGFPNRCLVLSVWVNDKHFGVILDPSAYNKPATLKAELLKLLNCNGKT